ncbi:MAG: hypothetical protein L6Q57_03600, partial [Alphaproteobacteria bacterium]|nr:hypothetical protein [Alphaproteobacteria bacterium]
MPKLKHLFTKAAAQGPLIVRALARDSGSAHALKTENNPSLKTALDNAQRFFANDEAIADEQ